MADLRYPSLARCRDRLRVRQAAAYFLRAVPATETGSATSFNQILRYVGYSVDSALSAVLLQAHTSRGHSYPILHEGIVVASVPFHLKGMTTPGDRRGVMLFAVPANWSVSRRTSAVPFRCCPWRQN